MSNSRKRLIKNDDMKETSNHTEILSESDIDLEQFAYNPNNSKPSAQMKNQKESKQQPKQVQQTHNSQTPKLTDQSDMKHSQKSSVQKNDIQNQQKPSAQRQSNIFQFFGKNVEINPQQKSIKKQNEFPVDLDAVDIAEQLEIERKIREQQQQKLQQQKQQHQQQQQFKNKIEIEEDEEIINKLKQVKIDIKPNTSKEIAPGVIKNFEVKIDNQQNKGKSKIGLTWNQSKPQQQQQIQPNPIQPLNQSSFQNDPNLLKGKTIVLSGLFSVCSRDKLDTFLKNNGAKVTGSISGKTTFLIVGSKLEDGRPVEEGNKFKAATAKGTKIIKEDNLDNWCKDNIGTGLDEIFGETNISKLYKASEKKVEADPQIKPSNISLADKYMPKTLKELVGNKTSCVQLNDWILKFQNPNLIKADKEDSKKKKKWVPLQQTQGFRLVGDLSSKACLISGPPGIGKSSMVRLVAEALGLKLIVNNASDQRNKSSLRTMLNDLIDNTVLMNLFRPNKKFLVVMDEVDGMTGSDRGGIAALIECIKSTRVPIVCICNDNDSTKLRSLLAQCFNIKFQKPEANLVAQRLKYICDQEQINMSLEDLVKMAECFDCDVRQCINMLEMQGTQQKSKILAPLTFKKDKVCVFNTFNAAQTLLNKDQRQKMSLREMMDMFFLDYDLIPLIIQDNYIKAQNQNLADVAKAAELIAEGDLFSKKIRRNQQWSLMPSFGFLSSVYPAALVGNKLEFPKFPAWLGKNSTAMKVKRESLVIKNRISQITYLTADVRLYSKYLFKLIKAYLELKITRNDQDAIWEVVSILEDYRITPEEFKEELSDQVFNPLKDNLLAQVNPTMKGSLTKMFNKRHTIPKEKRSKKQGTTHRQISDNYNPLIGEEAPLIEQQQSEQEEEKKDDEKVDPKKRNTKKQTKKGGKAQTKKTKQPKLIQSESMSLEESSNSLDSFIVDDDDE